METGEECGFALGWREEVADEEEGAGGALLLQYLTMRTEGAPALTPGASGRYYRNSVLAGSQTAGEVGHSNPFNLLTFKICSHWLSAG